MTERARFMKRLSEARTNGLVAMKLTIRTDRPLDGEAIFAALNEIEDAIDAGQCLRHKGWSGNQPAGVEMQA